MKPQTPQYDLKVANLTDLEDIKKITQAFFLSSIYKDKEYDTDKVNGLLIEYLFDPTDRVIILGLLEGKPVALFAAAVQQILFNDSRIATEVLWWVDAEHRRSGLGAKLIEAFEYWAIEIAKAEYTQLTSLVDDSSDTLDKYYQRIGYQPVEKAYLKAWQQ